MTKKIRILLMVMSFIGLFALLWISLSSIDNPGIEIKNLEKPEFVKVEQIKIEEAKVEETKEQPVSQSPAPQPVPRQVKQPPEIPQGTILSIPSIGIYSNIVSVGRLSNNAIDVPSSSVGRFNESPWFGNGGGILLDGHSPGVLGNLISIQVGQIVVVYSDGNEHQYRVISKEITGVDETDMRRALSAQGSSEGVNIITCTGSYEAARGTYSQRLVVYTERIN